MATPKEHFYKVYAVNDFKLGKELLQNFHAEGGGKDRDEKSLRNLWKRLKEQGKKCVTEQKRDLRKTGGGPSNFQSAPQEIERVIALLKPEQLHPPLVSLYDCDAIQEQPLKKRLCNELEAESIEDLGEGLCSEDVMVLAVNDTSQNLALLLG